MDLRTQLAVQLLRAAKHDASLTDHEKLSTHRCETIEKHLGFPGTPLGRAIEYSCRGLVIGVALYAGQDLGKHPPEKVAQHFKDALTAQNMTAEVFIERNHDHGTGLAFFINGESYTADWVGPMEALKFIDAMAAEARLIYFKNEQITPVQLEQWVKGQAPERLMY